MEPIGYTLLTTAYAILALYIGMLIYAIRGWKKLQHSTEKPATHAVSILVAARNESATIETVVRDLFKQSYPTHLFEVLVIDDHSEDNTQTLAQALTSEFANLKVLSTAKGEGKKAALATGIQHARFDIIATVDADCRVPSEWLPTMLSHWQAEHTNMLLGPLVLEPAITVFERIQSLEMHAIMGLTGGFAAHNNPIMANGANLFFNKQAFIEIGGYGASQNPSGDDVFTMLRFAEKWPQSVQFVKDYEAAVLSKPQPTFSNFWQQRKRWLSKKGGYQNMAVKASAIITYLANVAAFCALIAIVFSFGTFWADMLMWVLFLKTLIDLIIVRVVSRDLQPDCGITHILVAQVFIVWYVSFLGIFGNVKSYVWKGRTIRVDD